MKINFPINISAAFELLLEEVENEVELANEIGSQAFRDGLYDQVETAKRQAVWLIEYRRQMLVVHNQLQKAFKRGSAFDPNKPDEGISFQIVATQDDDETKTSGTTDPALLQAKREQIVTAFGQYHNTKLIKKSRATYWNEDQTIRIACAISRRYNVSGMLYWYSYHRQWGDFLRAGKIGHLVLGGMDIDIAFSIPIRTISQHLEELHATVKLDGTSYWHVKIAEAARNGYVLQLPKSDKDLDLSPYVIHMNRNVS